MQKQKLYGLGGVKSTILDPSLFESGHSFGVIQQLRGQEEGGSAKTPRLSTQGGTLVPNRENPPD